MTITTQKTATPAEIIIPETPGTTGHLPEIIPTENIQTPVPEMTMAQCQGDTVTATGMEEAENREATWTVPVVVPIASRMTVTVTLAAPHPHGAPHPPMVGAVEAVVTMTMAAVPGMAMAVVTVTPAVGVTNTHLAVVTEWAGRKGARPPLLTEVTPLVTHTPAQAAEGRAAAAAAATESIEEWLATDTEVDTLKQPWVSVHSHHVFWKSSDLDLSKFVGFYEVYV